MRSLKLVAGLTAVIAAAGAGTYARQAPPASTRIDVSRLGPRVGERVPDFSLRDQNGRVQTLQSIMGGKGAMLVFIRSADW
jgi:cytochrome oxidase Cu insertion factor (SCO1/SenC/PrrC family)